MVIVLFGMEMRNNLSIYELKESPIQYFEVVERKGLGHPDTICDSIMNLCSVRLSLEYLKKAGVILHHNIDKALLAAGETETMFGGGKVIKPMSLIFGDRATYDFGNESIDVDGICISAAKEWFKDNLRFVNPEEHVRYQIELKRGSAALLDIFKRKEEVLGANDTSASVGYAPMSETEGIVLELERYLNSVDFKKDFPETGEDIKIMAVRDGKKLELTVAMAFVDNYVPSEEFYFRRKGEILKSMMNFIKPKTKTNLYYETKLNRLDREGRGVDGVYLTVLGTSADGADCGQVGRGNKVNGVIPLNRPTGSEAAAGKNPVSHVGKIYNVLTHEMADKVYKNVPGLKEVYIWLISSIGQPINKPQKVTAEVVLDGNTHLKDIEERIDDVVNHELEHINELCMRLARGEISVC